MNHPWDHNHGSDSEEKYKTYRLFLTYLRLGVNRSVKQVALLTGETYHNIYGKFQRFNWKARADAFDEYRASGGDVSQYLEGDDEQDEMEAAGPAALAAVRVYKSSAPTKQVNDQIIRERLNDLGGLVHQAKMEEFSRAYEERGRYLFENGKDILSLIQYYASKIKEGNKRQSELLEKGDFLNYVKICTATDLLVNSYCKLWKAFETSDERARSDWGDAIGVGQLLEAMYRQVNQI